MSQSLSKVRYVTISEDRAGQRLDNFLFNELKSVPRSRVYKMLRSGEVRVNSRRARQTHRLLAGDHVRIPPVFLAETARTEAPSRALRNELSDRVLLEEKGLLVIDKPSGLAVHGGSGVSLGLIEAVRQTRPSWSKAELVHRLDRETSGCLMVATNRRTLLALQEQLREKRVQKQYLALVTGNWPRNTRWVQAPLERQSLANGERIVRVSGQGKQAKTAFHCQQRYRGYSLVQAEPITGRTHQIRVHAQHQGCPIAGDTKYAPREANRAVAALGLKRLFLHAERLSFDFEGSRREVYACLPKELSAFLEKLSK